MGFFIVHAHLNMKIRIILISSLVLVIIVGIAIWRVVTNKPPDHEINLARKMLSEAELVKSPKYATGDYLKASLYYDSAMAEWSRENERFIILRNYQRIGILAQESVVNSKNAIVNSKKNITKEEDLLEIRISEIDKRIKDFEKNLGSFPINSAHQKEIITCKLQYTEAVQAYKNKNYAACKLNLDSAETVIKKVFVIYEDKLSDYLQGHPRWKEMVTQTISYSRKNKAFAIIIDKLDRECFLYKDGKVISKYTIELGSNWIGDKNQQGDKSTPEGLYKVIDKKANGRTRFYKALLLDYPNEEDKKRFLQNKKNGIVKANASIGNLIEIHGDGGKGVDWTDGCIALSNTDMDLLFAKCPIGTKVTIVGSTKSLNELTHSLK